MENFEIKEKLSGLPIVNFHAAGIDIGSREMWVTYTNREGQICQFRTGSFTENLEEITHVLVREGITDVAMESTGVYGGPLREQLEVAGVNVTVMNPSMYKKPDMKNDSNDSTWIHLYHSVDLFKKSHFAPEHWRDLREYIHEREVVLKQKAQTLTRINRQLSMMNVKIQNVVSDIEGVGAMKVLEAIVKGETDAEKLVDLLNLNLFKASREDLVASLKGNYRPGLVYVLKEKMTEYHFFVSQMHNYEKYIIDMLEEISKLEEEIRRVEGKPELELGKPSTKKPRKNEYSFDGKLYLQRILGIDLTKVEGLDVKTILTILSVTGTDMSKWKSAEAFAAWLCLSPRPNCTGGKTVGHDHRKTTNPATQALRIAARSLHDSHGRLGAMYKKIYLRKGAKTAIKAVARKLSVLFYTLIKNGAEYSEDFYKDEVKKQALRDEDKLMKLAKKLGYELSKTD
jgi:transposase